MFQWQRNQQRNLKKTNIISSPKKLEEYNRCKPVQLSLFEFIEPDQKQYSNTIELYDAIPKYYWRQDKNTNNTTKTQLIEREFKHKGTEYTVTIQPTILKGKDGNHKVYYPNQREELVEDALRKLACEGSGIFLDDHAGVTFTLYQLQQELKQMGHTYSIPQN